MKKIVLMIGIVLCLANKTHAETWNCGPATNGVYSDSVQCTYDEATKTLTISGEGEMGDYGFALVDGKSKLETPWPRTDIVHAVVEGNVTSIGGGVFYYATNLTDIIGLNNIIRVGDVAFEGAHKLSSIDLPNVQEIGATAFDYTYNLEYAGIPTGVTYKPDRCIETPKPVGCSVYANRDTFSGSKVSNCQKNGDCGSCGEKVIQSGAGCVSGCFEGYYPTNKGYCKVIKLRYTIPEADAATSDDNENMIEWIFE